MSASRIFKDCRKQFPLNSKNPSHFQSEVLNGATCPSTNDRRPATNAALLYTPMNAVCQCCDVAAVLLDLSTIFKYVAVSSFAKKKITEFATGLRKY
jgi:hypothetical protein